MHIILLKFGPNKSAASEFMQAHNDWIARGFKDNIFQSVGSLDVGGGFILAQGEDKRSILQRVEDDPFVVNKIVDAEIYQIDVKRTSPELACLMKGA